MFISSTIPSQSSLDITEARIKRLRERAGRKYTYVHILIRFVKKTIERRKKNKPIRFLCSFCVSGYHHLSSSVFFSHVARLIGVTWKFRDNFYFQVQSILFFSYSQCARGNILYRSLRAILIFLSCLYPALCFIFFFSFFILSHYSAQTYRVDVDRNVVWRSRSTYIRATIIDQRSTQEEWVIETWWFVSFDASEKSSLSSWRAENVHS